MAFEITVSIVADLDCILDGFEHVEASRPCQLARERLFQQIDAYLATNVIDGRPSSKDLRDLHLSTNRRAQYQAICDVYRRCKSGDATIDELEVVGRDFFEDEVLRKRRAVLQEAPTAEILSTKRELLRLLRAERICLLEKGDIEQYYPDEVTGADKPSKAMSFCKLVDTREKVIALCERIPVPAEPSAPELELIFQRIFSDDLAPTSSTRSLVAA